MRVAVHGQKRLRRELYIPDLTGRFWWNALQFIIISFFPFIVVFVVLQVAKRGEIMNVKVLGVIGLIDEGNFCYTCIIMPCIR